MNVPTLSPGNRGYELVTITTTWRVTGPCGRASRQGVISDSMRTALETFDWPCRRSTKMIGHFADAAAAPAGFEQHLDQEGVAVRDHVARAADAPATRAASSGTRSCSRCGVRLVTSRM